MHYVAGSILMPPAGIDPPEDEMSDGVERRGEGISGRKSSPAYSCVLPRITEIEHNNYKFQQLNHIFLNRHLYSGSKFDDFYLPAYVSLCRVICRQHS